jgi:hypothetical protein
MAGVFGMVTLDDNQLPSSHGQVEASRSIEDSLSSDAYCCKAHKLWENLLDFKFICEPTIRARRRHMAGLASKVVFIALKRSYESGRRATGPSRATSH